MLRIKRVDHVAVCVADLDAAIARWRDVLGVVASVREVVASQETEVALLPFGRESGQAGGAAEPTSLELIAPRGSASLMRFLERRGPGLHHIALEVEGLDDALTVLRALGIPLIDDAPRIGARGHRVAFVHPRATGGVLVELVEPVDAPAR
jgi:methylmalonyl-CoA/ethylmalonyl-CoA epimerase